MSSFENLVASAQEEGQGVKLIGLASEVLSDDPVGWSAAYLLRRAPYMQAHGLRSCVPTSSNALMAGSEAPTLGEYRRALLSQNSNDAVTTGNSSTTPGELKKATDSAASSSAKRADELSNMVLPDIDVGALAPEVVSGLDKLAIDLLPGGALCGFRFLAPTARPALGPWLTLGPAATATTAAPSAPPTAASATSTTTSREAFGVLAPPSLAGGGTVDNTVVCLAAPVEVVVFERLPPSETRSLLRDLRNRKDKNQTAAASKAAAPSAGSGRKRSREESSARKGDSNITDNGVLNDAPWAWPNVGAASDDACFDTVENGISEGFSDDRSWVGKNNYQVFQLHAGDGAFVPKGCIYALRAALPSEKGTSDKSRNNGTGNEPTAWCGVVWWHLMHLGEGRGNDDNTTDSQNGSSGGAIGAINRASSDTARTASSLLVPSTSSLAAAAAAPVATACEVALAFAKEARLQREPTLGLPEQVIMQATRATLSTIAAQNALAAYNNVGSIITTVASGSAAVDETTSQSVDSDGDRNATRKIENPFQFWVDSSAPSAGSFPFTDVAAGADGGSIATTPNAAARTAFYVSAYTGTDTLVNNSRALLAGLLPSANALLSRDEKEATTAQRTIAHALHVEKVEAGAVATAAAAAAMTAQAESNTSAIADVAVAVAAAAAAADAAAAANSGASSEWSTDAHSDSAPPQPAVAAAAAAATVIVDAFVAPDSLNAVEPFSCEGFACQMCGAEAANSYLHCAGCESLLGADFNLCPSCYNVTATQDIARRCSNTSTSGKQPTKNLASNHSLRHRAGRGFKAMSTQRFHIVPQNEVRRWSSSFQSDGRCTNDNSLNLAHTDATSSASSPSSSSSPSSLNTTAPLVHSPCANCGACDHCACRCHAKFQLRCRFEPLADTRSTIAQAISALELIDRPMAINHT